MDEPTMGCWTAAAVDVVVSIVPEPALLPLLLK